MASGMPITFNVAFKPTPTIAAEQESVNLTKRVSDRITGTGRHDACYVTRVPPCVEAAAAIAITELIIKN
jgi:chorismate synthase